MLKICIISPSFANMNCGLADYVKNLVRFLSLKDLDIAIITSDNPKVREYVDLCKGSVSIKIYPAIHRWDCGALPRIRKIMDEINPDVVHIMYNWNAYNHGIFKGAVAAYLPFFLKHNRPKVSPAVVITFVHDIMGPYLFPKAGPIRKLWLFFMVFFTDKITVHAEYYKTKLIQNFLFLKYKITCIPCGCGVYYDPLLKKNNCNSIHQEIILSFFGYIYPSKGLEYLIEAVRHLINKDRKLKLVIIGGYAFEYAVKDFNSYHKKIKELISAYGLDNFVQWFGFCNPEDVSANLLKSDICVLPFNDGVNERGSTFNTALSHGLPLITTTGPYAPKSLVNQKNVLLVPPRNYKLLADAIELLMDNKKLRETLSIAGKELFDEQYSWPVIAEKTFCLYKDAGVI